jgi:hypothetical protein
MDEKDLELELRKSSRELVELVVAKELLKFTREVAFNSLECYSTKQFKTPDSRAWARKIIAVVKEHNV